MNETTETGQTAYRRIHQESACHSIFQEPWWLDAVEPNWSAVTAKYKQYEIALPFAKIKDRWGNYAAPPVGAPWLHWLSTTKNIAHAKNVHHQIEIANCLIESNSAPKDWIIRLPPGDMNALPWIWHNFSANLGYTYRIKLDPQHNWETKISKHLTRSAAKAVKQHGLRIERTPNPQTLHQLIEATFSRRKKRPPFTLSWVDRVLKTSSEHNQCEQFTAICNNTGKAYASALIVYDSEIAYHLLVGNSLESRKNGAASLLIFEAMKHFTGKVDYFDFEGSSIQGVEAFYRSWGGEQLPVLQLIRQQTLPRKLTRALKSF